MNKFLTIFKKDKSEIDSYNNSQIDKKIIMHYLEVSGIGNQLLDTEKDYFITIAIEYQLNPFRREIYCIPYVDYKGERSLSIVTGYEVYLKRAEEIGDCEGWHAWTEGELQKVTKKIKRKKKDGGWYEKEIETWEGNLVAKIEISRKGWKEPFRHQVEFSEYNKENTFWNTMPKTMIQKVVTAQGFRRCWSKDMGEMPYIREEMPDPDIKVIHELTPEEKNEQENQQIQIDKLEKLPDNIKEGFRALGYGRKAATLICEEQNWKNKEILKRINSIADAGDANESV